VRAWVSIDRDAALQQAQRSHEALRRGEHHGPLHGIPVGIKDVVDVKGWPSRAGSLSRSAEPPARRDADVVRALRAAGAVILGKTHTTEFAYFDGPPPTRNPWHLA